MLLGFHHTVIVVGHFVLIFIAESMNGPVIDDNGLVKVTLLEEYWSSSHRARRAADSNLPDKLSVAVPLNGRHVVLRMKRSRLLPTVTSDERSGRAANQFSEDVGVYTDLTMNSAMIVKREVNEYTLKGSFIHGSKEWSLEPAENQKRDAGERDQVLHKVFPQKDQSGSISYFGDDVEPPQERRNQEYKHGSSTGAAQRRFPRQLAGEDNHRKKRAPTRHNVEVAFIVDFADYSKWVEYFGETNAMTELRLWYTYIAESMNIRFQSIKDPDVSVRTSVTVLKVLTKVVEAAFISDLTNNTGQFDKADGLEAFYTWYPRQEDVTHSDHYMLFTGFSMGGFNGVAYRSRVCTDEGISICVNRFNGALSKTAAHELGHSLSAVHDQETTGEDRCSDDDQHVMATTFTIPVSKDKEGNPWTFSPCSIKSIKNYLSRVTCTVDNVQGDSELPTPADGQGAGQVLSRDVQCRLSSLNPSSYFCELKQSSTNGMESLCGGMYCGSTNLTDNCFLIVPQEFTTCGTNKWCIAGKCVDVGEESRTAAAATTTASADTTAASAFYYSTIMPTRTTIKSPTAPPTSLITKSSRILTTTIAAATSAVITSTSSTTVEYSEK